MPGPPHLYMQKQCLSVSSPNLTGGLMVLPNLLASSCRLLCNKKKLSNESVMFVGDASVSTSGELSGIPVTDISQFIFSG